MKELQQQRSFDPFDFAVWGRATALYTPTVAGVFRARTAIIVLVFFYGWWAFSRLFAHALPLWGAVPIGLVFALLIAYLNVLIMKNGKDKAHRWAYRGRVAAAIMAATINMLPFTLEVFAPEIEQIIANKEKANIDKIRSAREQREQEQQMLQAAEQKKQVERENASVLTQAEADTVAEEARLAKLRTEAQAEVDKSTALIQAGSSDPYASIALGSTARATQKRVAELEDSAGAKLAELRALRDKKRRDGQERLVRLASEQREQLDTALQSIRSMGVAQLVSESGGTWKEPRGLMAKVVALFEVVRRPASLLIFVLWALVGLFAELFVLLASWFTQAALEDYNNLLKQAEQGHPVAIALITPVELAELSTLRVALGACPGQLLAFTTGLINRGDDGLFPTLHQIQQKRDAWWNNCANPARLAVVAHERRLMQLGITVPEWGLDYGIDVRLSERLTITPPELITLGWEDPAPTILALEQAAPRLAASYIKLRQTAFSLLDEAARDIRGSTEPVYVLSGRQQERFREQIVPIIDSITSDERLLRQYGRALPPKPQFSPDLKTISDRLTKEPFSEFALRTSGWVGPTAT